MPGDAAAFIPLAEWAAQFLIIVARLSFIIFLMPGVGEQVVPVRLRAILLLGLSAAFASTGLVQAQSFFPLTDYFALLMGEVFIGFVLGVSLRLMIWILSIVGSVIAQSIGLAQFLGVALEHEAQTITANLLSMAGAVVLLSADYHVSVFVSVLDLYGEIPIGGYLSVDQAMFIDTIYSGFAFAILLAWPFLAVNLIYNICLGFINKALPSLMVAFVGAPFMVGAGLILLAGATTSLLVIWRERLPELVGWL